MFDILPKPVLSVLFQINKTTTTLRFVLMIYFPVYWVFLKIEIIPTIVGGCLFTENSMKAVYQNKIC